MSAGFYKKLEGYLAYAPNAVFNAEYTLIKEDKDELIHLDVFPIDGWYWFDSKEQAVEQLGVDFKPPLPRGKPNDIIRP